MTQLKATLRNVAMSIKSHQDLESWNICTYFEQLYMNKK